jgi:HSP20 family protein
MDDIFEEIKKLKRAINRKLFSPDAYLREDGTRIPLHELEETEKEIIARFELPGVEKKDIQLNITESKIEVRAEKRSEEKITQEDFIGYERARMKFYKEMILPKEIEPEKAKARYKEGILTIRAPKSDKSRKIQID